MRNSVRILAAASLAALLAACGGGGGGGGSAPPEPAYKQFEGAVAGCSIDTQKKFVRAYMDDVYLWYNEIPSVDAAAYNNIPDYFEALKVKTPDSNGVQKDRFSAVIPTSQAAALFASAPLKQDTSQLQQAAVSPVPQVFTAATGGGRRFGYIQFTDHSVGAHDLLIDAFRKVRDEGAQDLVLDLRQNSGGFLYIALSTASMITGPSSQGQLFERLRYNDKRTAESNASALNFSSTVQFGEARYPTGTALPQLGLPRVFILTSGATCSASESIINSLRGIDVQVVRIGTTTCGKPYGFREKDNCGWAYFPIEFQGANAKGYGDYTTGFTPNCRVSDNGSTPGGSTDPLLAEAKYYIDYGSCQPGTPANTQNAAVPMLDMSKPSRPDWAGRLLLPEQRH